MLKRLLRRLILREKADSQSFVRYLRQKGVTVGEDVRFFSPRHTHVDVTFPWLLTIGNHVSVAHGVIILTHDYAWSVVKRHPKFSGEILGAMSPVCIGDNVFIGMNTVITRGVHIGDHVIIGAGSVVTSDCPSDGVYAGNPARKLMSIEQFYEKRKQKQWEEAKTLAREYQKKHGQRPPKEVFWEYFMLFSTAPEAKKVPAYYRQMQTGGNYEDTAAYMQSRMPMFDGYDDFLDACFRD